MSNDGHSKIKILFVIHDLSVGGAEKVLINLVNNMDYLKFDVTVLALFDEGVNKQFLNSKIKYRYAFRHADSWKFTLYEVAFSKTTLPLACIG